jgi:hypothetical protein
MAKISVTTNDGVVVNVWTEATPGGDTDWDTRLPLPYENREGELRMWKFFAEDILNAVRAARAAEASR